jgi:two-component system invasion response regulator UvrY
MSQIKIVIVDDHKLVRETWSFILNSDPRFKVIGDCASGEEALIKVPRFSPHVVIMDINLPGINGIETTEALLKSNTSFKVLGVSLHTQPKYALKMLQAGAMGYVTKNSAKQEMYNAILEITSGNSYICEEIRSVVNDLIQSHMPAYTYKPAM